jgi:hypothetical protein
MTAAAHRIEWRVGRIRLALPVTIHAAALIAGIEIALEWTAAWVLVAGVALSAFVDARRWVVERRESSVLVLIPGGVAIDGVAYCARRAWLGPGWAAIWLQATTGRRRLVHVVRGEVTHADHAALRRHVKAMEFV